MNDSTTNPVCVCPTERQNPTGIGRSTVAAAIRKLGTWYGWFDAPSTAVGSTPSRVTVRLRTKFGNHPGMSRSMIDCDAMS